MSVGLMPLGNDAPFIDSSGNPLSGGLLYFYTAGSSTPQNTYTTSAGSVANANPVVLDSGGYPSSAGNVVEIWGTIGVSYKAVLKTSAGVTVWTRDNLPIMNDTTVTVDQWVAGPAPTYVNATSFTLVGDQTSAFHVGRRLKTTNSGGTIYSRISASVFGALTTVTVVNDSGTLDAGLSAVSYALLSASNPSVPVLADSDFLISGSADRTKLAQFEVDGLTTATKRTYTLQDSSDTLVGRATTDTLTNKTLTSPVIDTAVTGTAIATQAQQETGTATNVLVTPGRQAFHPSAAKAWCIWNTAGAISASYNVTSVTDSAAGDQLVNLTTAFSSANYVAIAGVKTDTTSGAATTTLIPNVMNTNTTSGVIRVTVARASDGAYTDPSNSFSVVAYGDQ